MTRSFSAMKPDVFSGIASRELRRPKQGLPLATAGLQDTMWLEIVLRSLPLRLRRANDQSWIERDCKNSCLATHTQRARVVCQWLANETLAITPSGMPLGLPPTTQPLRRDALSNSWSTTKLVVRLTPATRELSAARETPLLPSAGGTRRRNQPQMRHTGGWPKDSNFWGRWRLDAS